MNCDEVIGKSSRGRMLLNLALRHNVKQNEAERTEKADYCAPETSIHGKIDSVMPEAGNTLNFEFDQASCPTDVGHPATSQQISEEELLNDLYLSSSEADDTDKDETFVPQEGSSDADDENLTIKSGRKVLNQAKIVQQVRKRVKNPKEWLVNKRKAKRAAGKEYINNKGKVIAARTVKPPCACKFKCYEKITETMRMDIFNQYWDERKDINTKRQFVASCVQVKPIKRSRERDGSKPKTNTLIYTFTINNENVKVCKLMFLNTLSISNRMIINAIKKRKEGGIMEPDLRGKKSPANKTPQKVIDLVCQHIASFPSYESHYCRENTGRKFLETGLSIAEMHRLYLKFCQNHNIGKKDIADYWLYANIFNTKFNLSFKPPGTDTCDTCDTFVAQLKSISSEEEKEKIKSVQESHLQEAEKRYNLKKIDIASAKINRNHKVLTGDLQKCLPTPLCTSTISFYKRKLWTFNYTLHDSSDGSASCIMWDESKAGRGGNEIASAIIKWADQVIPNTNVNEITLWSDNCYGQNKNISLIIGFFWILHKYKTVKVINQKFLLKGHTHMEADAVHGVIEKKRKNTKHLTITTPWDWQQLVRHSSDKYTVYNMEKHDFKKLQTLYLQKSNTKRPETRRSVTENLITRTVPFVYRKKDVNKRPVLLSQCIHLQVRQENIGILYVKEKFEDDQFREVNMIRKSGHVIEFPESLASYNTVKEISTMKYNDLISLLQFLPTESHDFYKNLRHAGSAPDFPVEDEAEDENDD